MTKIVSRAEWLEARKAHLEDEKAFTKARDALSARRRALPWARVDTQYTFRDPEGAKSLSDLFGPHKQLIIMHFMFGPDWDEGCPSCSFWADGFDGLDVHLAHRDTALVLVSNTSVQKIEAYKARMGWSLPWVSSLDSAFNQDFQVSFTEDQLKTGAAVYNYRPANFPSTEAPGLSVFYKPQPDVLVHTYSTYSRGLDMMNAAYHLLDLSPMGRDEDGLGHPMAWLRRRDRYGT